MNDDYGSRPSPNRLYRNPEEGKLLGVCAGLGDYFGINPWTVRIMSVISLLLFTLPTLVTYFVAAAFMQRRPDGLYATPAEEDFWRDVRTEPSHTVSDLKLRFQQLERRLRAIEAYVTSKEFALNREINNLER